GEVASEFIYRYVGPALAADETIDLEAQDYANDTLNWARVEGDAGTVYAYLGTTGTVDLALEDFTGPNWQRVAGGVYKYVGAGGGGLRLDLATQDYGDTSQWQRIGGEAGALYVYVGGGAPTLDLGLQDYGDATRWKQLGAPGAIYEWLGATQTVNLSDPAAANFIDYTNLDYWKEVLVSRIIPSGYNVSSSDSTGVGALIVLNDVRSDV